MENTAVINEGVRKSEKFMDRGRRRVTESGGRDLSPEWKNEWKTEEDMIRAGRRRDT